MRMVDDDDLLPRRTHRLVQLELLLRIEAEEGRRAVRVDHSDQSGRYVSALRPDNHPTRLIRMIFPSVGDHGVHVLAGDLQHGGQTRGDAPPQPSHPDCEIAETSYHARPGSRAAVLDER